MKKLNIPSGIILEHAGEMYKMKTKVPDRNFTREQIGILVKYYGGDKVLRSGNKLLILETIEDANVES